MLDRITLAALALAILLLTIFLFGKTAMDLYCRLSPETACSEEVRVQ